MRNTPESVERELRLLQNLIGFDKGILDYIIPTGGEDLYVMINFKRNLNA